MGRSFHVVWLGRRRRDEWESLCDDYQKRIARFVSFHEQVLRPRPELETAARLEAETRAVRNALPERALVVAVDRGGRAVSSTDLARQVTRWLDEWPHPIVFILGSDLGLAPTLVEEARFRLSLGPLTLPHQLARLVLYEQLYRALCVRGGIKYHRASL